MHKSTSPGFINRDLSTVFGDSHLTCSTEIEMSRTHRPRLALLPASPLLITESAVEFDRLRDAFDQELKPRGIIDQMCAADIAYLSWEILRLRRCKAGIINSAFRAALEDLLEQLLREPGAPFIIRRTYVTADTRRNYVAEENKVEELACRWFSDSAAKKQIAKLLRDFQLDESVIEAEAIRRSSDDLEKLDRLLASLESRRHRALRCLADYRGGFARQLRESSDRIIDGKVLALENASSKKPSAVA